VEFIDLLSFHSEQSSNLTGLVKAAIQQYKALYEEFLQQRPGVSQLVHSTKKQFCKAPASSKTDYFGCFEGGLVVHSVNTTQHMLRLYATLKPENVAIEDVVFLGLFHAIGKIGTLTQPYFLPAEDWQIKKGQHYIYNDQLINLDVWQRSLLLMNQFGIQLSEAELQALAEQDAGNNYKEKHLTLLLRWGKYWSTHVDGL
jgi:hypothetical protein